VAAAPLGYVTETIFETRRPQMADEKLDDLKGRAKEAAGDLTGNEDLEREGKADQAGASVKDKVNKVADAVKDKVDDLKK